MLYQIAPVGFDIGMRFASPEAGDFALCFQEGEGGRTEVALATGADGALSFPVCGQLPDGTTFEYLFAIGDARYFLTRSPAPCDPAAMLPPRPTYSPIRSLLANEACEQGFVATTALHLDAWYRDNAFCGRCGSPMAPSTTERALVCSSCTNTVYPRISPAIIVAVTDGDRLLLTRYAQGSYRKRALVAGFVEVGETPEQAVEREVWEECGVHVEDVRYIASQPWGLSGSLMLGFTARLDGSPEISLQDGELDWAGWVPRSELGDGDDYALGHALIKAFRAGRL